MNSIYTLI